jgi:uncharacterized membrane protein YbhN (UPF0104 family)
MKINNPAFRDIIFLGVVSIAFWMFFKLFDGEDSTLYTLRQSNFVAYTLIKITYLAFLVALGFFERKYIKQPGIK